MLIPLVLAVLTSASAVADVAANDARLNDICFVDAQHGWAVGDRGVIWSTDDGGRQWRAQASGVTCSLAAVCFQGEQLGWAAGGFTHPYTHTSTGVLLTTRDGGKTWAESPKLGLPALRRLRFLSPQHGWAIGCHSAMYPSGLFVTDDGGRHWRPLPGGAAGWLAADLLDSRTGALAGRNGSLAVVSQGQIEAVRSDQSDLRNLVQMRLSRPAHGWLVGDGGAVYVSNDLGSTWLVPPGGLPAAARQFDFAALAVRGSNCWIAGRPGTRVFRTTDTGRTWGMFPTGTTVPLRALWFVDDQHGWAVGELGTILATGDGGRTWQRQRAGGDRSALLGLLAEPEQTPLELIARLAGDEGYLTVVDVLGRRDVEIAPRDDVHLADRLHEAVVAVGGCGADVAWQFPLRQPGLRLSSRQIVEAWDRVHDGHGMDELQAYLVRQIRLWRPDVIVTHDVGREAHDPYNASCEDDGPLVSLVHRAVLQAVGQAADGTAFAAQITDAGLEPWTVKKVYGMMASGTRGANDLVTAQFAPRLGRSLAEAATEPRGLLHGRFTLSPPTLGFRLLSSVAPQEQDRRDFFVGIALSPGGPARRALSPPVSEGLDLRQRLAQRRRHVEAILDSTQRTTGSLEPALAQIDDLCRDLDAPSRGQILYQLADRSSRTGHWPLAAEAFEALVERYPQHALTPSALLWLVQYYASAEAAWRVEHADGQKRLERAAALGKQIERTRPELFAEPALCFPLAAAYRGLDQVRQAERFYQIQSCGGDRDGWSACAQGELHLAGPNAKAGAAKPTLTCVRVQTRPHLDGLLDDPVWQQAKPAALQSAQHDDGDWPAVVMLAYDAEFLYLAARCRQAPTAAGPVAETGEGIGDGRRAVQRTRDADLSANDRIEILIDVDRDFTTYYRLAIDQRGWTNDRCWDDSTWNPSWFVAAKREAGVWTVEAAIPLAELAGRPPQPGSTWAIGIQRVVPGVGFQSWNSPAAISVLPDGFGYLAFR
jgi:photosystem II stability/assembly factor-like uncharacterized protein